MSHYHNQETREAFKAYIENSLKQSKGLIKTYYELKTKDDRQEALNAIIDKASKNEYIEVNFDTMEMRLNKEVILKDIK